MLIGIGAAAAGEAAVLTLIGVIAGALGHETSFRDAGDIFTKLNEVAAYTDERLRAAASGAAMPSPPQLLGDPVTARIAYAMGIVNLLLLGAIVIVACGQPPGVLGRRLGLRRYSFERAWLPILAAATMTVALGLYAAAVHRLDAGWFEPGEAAPQVVTRDGWSLLLFGAVTIVMAPLAEEMFFRGLVFGGALGLGALPAAALSAFLFAAWHLDLAAIVPVVSLGLVLAWLFWLRGSLWDSIIFHAAFNAAALVQLLGGDR